MWPTPVLYKSILERLDSLPSSTQRTVCAREMGGQDGGGEELRVGGTPRMNDQVYRYASIFLTVQFTKMLSMAVYQLSQNYRPTKKGRTKGNASQHG